MITQKEAIQQILDLFKYEAKAGKKRETRLWIDPDRYDTDMYCNDHPLDYSYTKSNAPEDIVEGRMDFDTLKCYADNMAYALNRIGCILCGLDEDELDPEYTSLYENMHG